MITTYTAKGVLPHEHPLNYGAVSGYMDGILGFPALDTLFGPADLSSRWVTTTPRTSARHVGPRCSQEGRPRGRDAEPHPPGVFRPDVDVVVDPASFLAALDRATADMPTKQAHDIQPLRARIAELLSDSRSTPTACGYTR